MTFISHTMVKNGMPFIGRVLRQVEPLMDAMEIALSVKADKQTVQEVKNFADRFGKKVHLIWEDQPNPASLTDIRNLQVKWSKQDWILFLDDDDYWETETLKKCLQEIEKGDPEILAYSVRPYQLIDAEHYDSSWKGKSFSKFLKRDGLQYKGGYPRDLPCDSKGEALYWKTHLCVKELPYKFFHLSYLKSHSFRNEPWAVAQFGMYKGDPVPLPKSVILTAKHILKDI